MQWILDTARPYSEIVLERSRQNGGAWQETRYTHTLGVFFYPAQKVV